jgi:hypothetical protein
LIGLSRNWALSLRIWVRLRGKIRFLVDNSDTWDHFVEKSITTRKKWNGPLRRSTDPQISTFNWCRNGGIDMGVFEIDGWMTSLP